MQNTSSDSSRRGMLGLGQASATQIQFAFSLINSLTPIVGALLADGRWGRYRTILYAFPYVSFPKQVKQYISSCVVSG